MARIDMRTGAPNVPSQPLSGKHEASSGFALVVDHVHQNYDDASAVEDVSFALSHGEILALVGHSGSGKSTLLRIIAGLERPQSGRVLVENREVSGANIFVPPERRGIGLMFQDYALFPHMTAFENVKFGLGKLQRAEADRIARAALDRIGLTALANQYPHTLSGGEQQRVALARALAPAPSFLLMDEPFSNLDRRTRDLVRDDTINVLRRNRDTAILVTHDPEEAMRLADRIVLLRSGRVVQTGLAEELYHRPTSLFVARFFSEFDEVEAVIRNGTAECALGNFPADGLADGTKATICIRPNAIRFTKPGTGVKARIQSRRFLGESDLIHVGVDGLAHALHARVPEDIVVGEGETVGLEFSRNDVIVFANADA